MGISLSMSHCRLHAPVFRAWGPFLFSFLLGLVGTVVGADFSEVEPILQQYCVECHGFKDPENNLVMETLEGLLKGGDGGPAILKGQSKKSLLILAAEGQWGKTGKNQFMPPGKRDHMSPAQIATISAWIDSGAPGPMATASARPLVVPKIAPKVTPPRSVHAIAFEPKHGFFAVARGGEVELIDAGSRQVERTLSGFKGLPQSLSFSIDGQFVFAGGGEAGMSGEVCQWRVADGGLVRRFQGHRDAITALDISQDGALIATGSYDYSIHLWSVADGKLQRTIAANQGAISDLHFRAGGKVLASSSFDRTAKLYSVDTGERLETFGQALKELNALAWSPDGRWLATGGNDNRIRVYDVSSTAREGSNPMTISKFAHEGAILRLAFSPDGQHLLSSSDDRTVKLFSTGGDWSEKLLFELQPDWVTAMAFFDDGKGVVLGRFDGTLGYYNTADGKLRPPPKPQIGSLEPRGIRRGETSRINLFGRNLAGLSAIKFSSEKLKGSIESTTNRQASLSLTADPGTPRGAYEVTLVSSGSGEATFKVWVDDTPQQLATNALTELPSLPIAVWGSVNSPGTIGKFRFHADTNQTLLIDLAANSLGAEGTWTLSISDADGHLLARRDGRDRVSDPALIFPVPSSGDYEVHVSEILQRSGVDYFYRLTIGALPYVTGVEPISLPAHQEVEARLVGINLPEGGLFRIQTGDDGVLASPPAVQDLRRAHPLKWQVTSLPTLDEVEPNDATTSAQLVASPVSVNGRIHQPGDRDCYAFSAKAGKTYVIETTAAQLGSPLDSRIEVLWPDGRPVERVQLRAVRDSAITFRGTEASSSGFRLEHWEEMELNELLYVEGEVIKLFRMPQGPDSDMTFYTSNGGRRAYFDSSSVAHALDTPAYIVEPYPPGAPVPATGLPVFHLNFENDDDSLRQLGADSRLSFVAPTNGNYVVRVTDSRGFGGPDFAYRLVVREANPDFKVTLSDLDPTIAAGSGQSFQVTAQRIDGFDGPIRVRPVNLPAGWVLADSLLIEAGHNSAEGTLFASSATPDVSPEAWDAFGMVASAKIDGHPEFLDAGNLDHPKLAADPPKLQVRLEPNDKNGENALFLAPGQTTSARLSIVRNGFTGVVRFDVRNLPHGVIVDNLGLNGITFLENENEREIFVSAAKWVQEMDRPVFAVETVAGNHTSAPISLKIRKAVRQTAAK
jgi:WD40 repeat protein